jgi:hypothetical protein
MKKIIQNMIQSTGAKGMMVDFGEAFPVESTGISL